jgi:succinyl-diaminopimelate desuccinylase
MEHKSADLDVFQDVVTLTEDLINIPSESRNELRIADAVEAALAGCQHLTLFRDGNTVIARTELGRSSRVVIAGHLDTVPSSGNDRAIRVQAGGQAPVADVDGSFIATEERLYGLGASDMKGGVAVGLHLAATIAEPTRDVTYIFYDCEEIDSQFNGLRRIAESSPHLLEADFAVLMEPSNAGVEGGCQGTMRFEITLDGRRAHTARSWMGSNAIHKLEEVLAILNSYEPRQNSK